MHVFNGYNQRFNVGLTDQEKHEVVDISSCSSYLPSFTVGESRLRNQIANS